MLRPRHTILAVLLASLPVTTAIAQNPDSLLARMTLEEKLGQLNLLSAGGRASCGRGASRGSTGRVFLRADRKSTRLNSSHLGISYAVFCLKKKKDTQQKK